METRNLNEEREREAFARRAASYFDSDVTCTSYTDDGRIESGQLVALRWGLDGDCVLVLKVDDYAPVVNYTELGRRIRKNDAGGYEYVDSTK